MIERIIILKSIIGFCCVVVIRCLTCGVAHNTIDALRNLDLNNNMPIVEDEENPNR
jgi:hypothetical protein